MIPRIAESERRTKNGPDTIESTLWFAGDSLWRTAVDQSDFAEKYMDQGVGGGASWMLTQRSMELRSLNAEPRGPFEGQLAIGLVRAFISQGLTQVFDPSAPIELKTLRSDEEWLLEFSGAAGSGRVAGTWDAEGSPEIREITYLDPAGGPPLQRVVVSGVVFDSALDSPRATRLELHSPYSNVTIGWSGTAPISKEEVARRAAPPDPTGADPVRGELSVTRVNDLRGDVAVIRTNEGDDDWSTVTQRQVASDFAWLRRLGWAMASLIVIVILGLRVRAARGT